MPDPIDLSQVPPRGPAPRPQPIRPGGKRGGRGTGTAIDEYARKFLWPVFIISLLLLGYLLAGMYTGAWSKTNLHQLSPAAIQRQMQNIALVYQLLQVFILASVVCLLLVAMRDEKLGYVLLGIGLIFYAGLPWLTAFVYDWRNLKPSQATNQLVENFHLLSALFFVPGVIWIGADLVRRFQSAAEAHAIQRVNMKYGTAVPRQKTVKQRFLGSCWQLPFCRDHVREKCPIYLQKRGPCWWHKEGCMCEERIILQAVINDDWKQKAARADAAYNFGQARAQMTQAAKRERCRKCVIYNEHQRQKYKAVVTVTLIVLPILVYQCSGGLETAAVRVLAGMEAVMERFSFGEAPTMISFLHGRPSLPIEWTVIGVLCMMGLTQILKLIEYCCFKLKI